MSNQLFNLLDRRSATPDKIREFFESGIDINQKDSEGRNAIQIAIHRGILDLEIYNILIEKGIDINSESNSGSTAIMDAVSLGSDDLILFLLKNIKKFDNPDIDTLVSYIQGGGTNVEIIELFLQKGINPYFENKKKVNSFVAINKSAIKDAIKVVYTYAKEGKATPERPNQETNNIKLCLKKFKNLVQI